MTYENQLVASTAAIALRAADFLLGMAHSAKVELPGIDSRIFRAFVAQADAAFKPDRREDYKAALKAMRLEVQHGLERLPRELPYLSGYGIARAWLNDLVCHLATAEAADTPVIAN